ncbi:MAG: glycosyltransferase [Prevotellaceae bacterium]|nr:glycosyltransferase [Prevotellaceae bacterium]
MREKKLSVVMSFLNEREEVGRTIRSIRETAGNSVDIVVVNDASEQDYDYEGDFRDLNVKYHVNESRVGAAQGKDEAVQLCDTPYFIILDAHMRFYDKGWAQRLVRELDSNSNQLLCCQTRVLSKQEDGSVVDKGEMGVFGAYLRFSHDAMIPGIKWNDGKIATSLDKGQIAAVLGASYCTSKSYWNKLRGLRGLIHYGCEEAYISIKAWLEGGGCRLIDDVSIGHIYRSKAPYHIDSLENSYNYYLIAETLFPTSLCGKAHAIGVCQNKAFHEKVMKLLDEHSAEIKELRMYYSENLNRNKFSYIIDINNVLTAEDLIVLKEEKHRLGEIIGCLCRQETNPDNLGIAGGECSRMLALAMFANMFHDAEADDKATELFNMITDRISSDLSCTFNSGLCGIGWALIFLFHEKIVSADDIREDLYKIDRLVMERNLDRVSDFSIERGTAGVMAYLNSRLAMKDIVDASCFDSRYLTHVYVAAKRIVDEVVTDWRVYSVAFTYIRCYEQGIWDVLPPRIEDFFDLPYFLPRETKFQKKGMGGAAGFAIYLSERQMRSDRFRKISVKTSPEFLLQK